MSRAFNARYPGTCGDCSDDIEPGDQVGYDDTDSIVCADCLAEYLRIAISPKQACPDCNLDHSGSCDR